jgi:hypothetical protein
MGRSYIAGMARIDGIAPDNAGFMTRLAYWFAKKKVGQVPVPLTIYAHNPWVMRAYGSFEMGADRARTVDKRLKVLVGGPW